jgi:hypothetical protein
MLLVAGASLPSAAMATATNGVDSATTVPAAGSRADTVPGETGSGTTNPGEMNPGGRKPDATPADSLDACAAHQACVDDYLWSLYERTPKIDTVSTPEQTKVTVKRKGKTATVTKTVMKLAGEDFAWKDPKAAGVAGMTLVDYVIGGMDPDFRVTLYRALRMLDDAGFKPGIMCAFRDDYRQSIATGLKAQNDRSFHGGSFRGGYGHGRAADIVSVRGETRTERLESTGQMWDFIDRHEKELGIGRPYLDRDPPHVAPLGGEEYADHRLRPKMQRAESAAGKNQARNKAKDHVKDQAKNPAKGQAKSQTKEHAKEHAKSQARNQAKDVAKNLAKNQARDLRIPAHNDHTTLMRTQVAKPPSRVQARTRTRAI